MKVTPSLTPPSVISFLVASVLTGRLCSGIGIREYPYLVTESNCPEDDAGFLENPHVPWGVPFRAHKTLPEGLRLDKSTIDGAGLGIISEIFLRAYTWLGEYDGEVWVVPAGQAPNHGWYTWDIRRNGSVSHYIDADRIETSNWLRWINSPRTLAEDNVLGVACRGRLYYLTIRHIYPGQELFVYYGHQYSKVLKLDWKRFVIKENRC